LTVEVLTWRGLATYSVLFFLHLETRRATLAGITQHPPEEWMVQMAAGLWMWTASCSRSVLFCMTATASSALPFHMRSIPLALNYHPARAESESDCFCGALGTLHQKRVSIEADPLW
jgi:hypothetical protein